MGTFGKSKGGGRRIAPRTEGPLRAVVTTLSGSRSADLVDISGTGARLCANGLPEIGEEISVKVEGVSAFGTVVWADGDIRGMVFDEPLTPDAEQLLRQKVAEAAGLSPDLKAAFDEWTVGVVR